VAGQGGDPPNPQLAEEPAELGPWFAAKFHGRCAGCKETTNPGELIRANGAGGYLGECCST
jgi:hypothetical protein